MEAVRDDQVVRPELGDRPDREPPQRRVDATAQHVEDVLDTGLAVGGQPPQIGAADQHRLRAQRERLDDIGAAAYASVHHHVDLVAGLPAGQRAIVTLYYADDQSVEAIADVLGIAAGTVKAQLFKAREALRTQLANLPQGER